MFRLYDREAQDWVDDDNVAITPDGDIILIKDGLFGTNRIEYGNDARYTYHNDIGLFDKEDNLIYEGDFCKSNDDRTGLIYYSEEKAAYIFLDLNKNEYLDLGKVICSQWLTVIGNVFDNPEYVSFEGNDNESKSTLSE